jgi:quercetin dioxygenase-like cupin family protein
VSAVVSRGSARHYPWGQACDGWHLLEGEDLSVIEERVPPGAGERRHRHRAARQFFYVLAGAARLEVEGAVHRLEAGEGLHVAPGQAHELRNEGPAELRFLVVSAPRSHGDREDAPA